MPEQQDVTDLDLRSDANRRPAGRQLAGRRWAGRRRGGGRWWVGRVVWSACLGGTEAAVLAAAWVFDPLVIPVVTMLAALAVAPLVGAVAAGRRPPRIAAETVRALGLNRRPDLRVAGQALLGVTVVFFLAVLVLRIWTGRRVVMYAAGGRPAPRELAEQVVLVAVLAGGIGESIFVVGLARRLTAVLRRRPPARPTRPARPARPARGGTPAAATGEPAPAPVTATRPASGPGRVPGWALVVATAVWTVGHVGTPPFWLVVTFIQGLLLAWAYRRSGSLWTAVIAHAGWDICLLAHLDPRIPIVCAGLPLVLLAGKPTNPGGGRAEPGTDDAVRAASSRAN